MSTAEAPTRQKRLTIRTVCDRLKAEFADISISKIRYLEDQGLLAPQRTQGGYRLFSEEDVERLGTILRLERDELLPPRLGPGGRLGRTCGRGRAGCLPLRGIRGGLAAGAGRERKRRRAGIGEAEQELDLE